MEKSKELLQQRLGLFDVFSIAAGAMISSGLFILPSIIYNHAGPGIIISYLLASLLMLPSVFSKAELTTAMPRAGGTYFYVERTFGSLWGIFTGLANWFSLSLKSAFAIVGMALFIQLIGTHVFQVQVADWGLRILSVGCCLFFGMLNWISVKSTTRFQNTLVVLLIAILTVFLFWGAPSLAPTRYTPFVPKGWLAVLSTTGLVFISYGGLTKIDNIAEEVHHAGKNLPRGMILAWIIVSFLYVAVVSITIGVLDGPILQQSPMPISTAASQFSGRFGFFFLSFAALAAFLTTANAGILSASRCPMSMSRDHLLPKWMSRLHSRFQTPYISILFTCLFMSIALLVLDLEQLVKTASTLMILLFLLDNASVIVMRESRLQNYRPHFKAPFYPYLQIGTIVLYILLLIDMGPVPLSICGLFFLFSLFWYWLYARPRVSRESAVMYIVERVTDQPLKTIALDNELRDILIRRDNIIADRFDKLIQQCPILDLKGPKAAIDVFRQVAEILSERLQIDADPLVLKFLQREEEGSTVIQPGLAIPHIVVKGENLFDVVLVRATDGILFHHTDQLVHTVFFLTGSKDQRNYHLRALMAIAQIIQEKEFTRRWMEAPDQESLRNLILLSQRKRDAAQYS